MLRDRIRAEEEEDDDDEDQIRDIHALTPPHPPVLPPLPHSHRSSSLSVTSTSDGALSENFSTMSREFNALVLAGSTIANHSDSTTTNTHNNNNIMSSSSNVNDHLGRIGEDEMPSEEMNPLAIVPDTSAHALPSPRRNAGGTNSIVTSGSSGGGGGYVEEIPMQRVKKEEVETKITAWQTAKVAKINNRFKREDAIINGWESEQVHKATTWMKKIERKLEDKRAKALEKMQNDVAKAHRKAEEKRASAEAKRGTKVARVFEISNLMRALGRPPVKRSFF